MKSSLLRKSFLDFFKQYDHKIYPSDSLIPSSDPTLLFTSAGMVQFKNYFISPGKLTRAASCQKCFRTSDIDKIGYTTRHLTFFEMLGNFSFGDYFKKEAIEWSWEFLTKEIGIDKSKLYVSVFNDDTEAYDIWHKIVPKDRIIKLDEKSNFWNMGPTGPCGPCSEIIYDAGKERSCGKPTCLPGCDCDRWLEVWNLVFTQFDRLASGELKPLKNKNIDTGMGLERLAMLCQNVDTVFATDLFTPIITYCKKLIPLSNPTQEYHYRILADHIRAITFLIADGVLPSNEGRGYVLRRIIRRASRQGKLLNKDKPFLFKVASKVIEVMKDTYPELEVNKENIFFVIKSEEEKFLATIDSGLEVLNKIITAAKEKNMNIIDGREVFKLYDTYGFPPELSMEILQENNLTFDSISYQRALEEAQQISRKSWSGTGAMETSIYTQLSNKISESIFRGYETISLETEITALLQNSIEVDILSQSSSGEILLKETTFYAEAGGQVGDTGVIKKVPTNAVPNLTPPIQDIAEVIDTQKPVKGLIVHKVRVIKGTFHRGDKVIAEVDPLRRKAIMQHHTATHLLHAGLRKIVGKHITQAGSLVAPDRLRFDYTHFAALDSPTIKEVEKFVNEAILANYPVLTTILDLSRARELGAMALFGEKYEQKVRTVMISHKTFNEPEEAISIELCAGTHVNSTAEIGLFKILSETSIGAGLRRIEAICGIALLSYLDRTMIVLSELCDILRTTPQEIIDKVNKILTQNKNLQKELEKVQLSMMSTGGLDKLLDEVEQVGKINLLIHKYKNVSIDLLRNLSDQLLMRMSSGIILLISEIGNKVSFVIALTDDLVEKKYNTISIGKEFATIINGSCGGRKNFCQGGGKDITKIDLAINRIKDLLKETL